MTSAPTGDFSYPAGVARDDNIRRWPGAGYLLLRDLRAGAGHYALMVQQPWDVDALVDRLSSDLGLDTIRLGQALAERETPPSMSDIDAVIGDANLLADLEVLMWPNINTPVLSYLRGRARTRPTIAVWPGEVVNGYARFSRPGRPDYHNERLDNVTVLLPVPTHFPDEVPFVIEGTES